MNPRLPKSKKWTAFPEDYISQIHEVFSKGYEPQLKDCKLVIEGRIYSEEILLRVGVLEPGRLRQANFEISINYKAAQQDAIEKIYSCIDAAASMMSEYFETDGEASFPRVWKEFVFEKQKLFMQFTTDNTELEAQADSLLGASPVPLVVEKETEDALDLAEETIATEESAEEDEFDGDENEDMSSDDIEKASGKNLEIFGAQKPKKKRRFSLRAKIGGATY